jgi:hypothetical protein
MDQLIEDSLDRLEDKVAFAILDLSGFVDGLRQYAL